MPKMKAATQDEFGIPADVLKMKEMPVPTPDKDEILVRMTRTPIHNHDIQTVRGEYGKLPDLPAIGGSEAVGIVETLGSDVTSLQQGARVLAVGVSGAWAEFFVAPASAVIPVPHGISDEVAAQLMAMPASALMALNKIPANRADWIVVNAANGAVGKSIAQLAKARGLNVASIVNREEAKLQLEEIGFQHVFVAGKEGWVEDARNAIDGHVAGGVEMIGGAAARDLISLVDQGGTILSFGAMSDEPMVVDANTMIFNELVLKGFWGLREFERATPEEMQKIIGELVDLAQVGKLELPVHKIYDLAEASIAAEDYYKPRNGKLMFGA